MDTKNLDLSKMVFSTGYIGSMGTTWKTPTQDDLEKALLGAMKIEGKNREEIVAILESGGQVRWCTSPNFYYDHSYGKIGTKQEPKKLDYPNGRKLDCGCTVYYQSEVMSASMGTSCQNCYDRMSN